MHENRPTVEFLFGKNRVVYPRDQVQSVRGRPGSVQDLVGETAAKVGRCNRHIFEQGAQEYHQQNMLYDNPVCLRTNARILLTLQKLQRSYRQ